jgi:hypothetical protein
MNYSDFQNKASSEKIVLALLDCSKRLMGWSVHAGSVYVLSAFEFEKVISVEDSGTAYTEVASLGAIGVSKYYHDRAEQKLYIQTSDSTHPNGKYLVATFRLFFSNVPIALPNDLDEGYEVFFEPIIQSNSDFGVEIDTIANSSEAIEGSGTLTLRNDFDFWQSNFDKLNFENQDCILYSYNRELELDQVKKIFKGKVLDKKYSTTTIVFQLRDQLSKLRDPIALSTIGDLAAKTPTDLAKAKQRMVLGRVFGMRPTNIDQVVDGYPLTGTVSINVNNTALTGVGTEFLKELSPDDELILGGEKFAVASVTSDTAAVLAKPYSGTSNLSGASVDYVPDQPKRHMNRIFKVAGHAVREPVTTTEAGSTVQNIYVGDTTDIFAGDRLYIGTLGSGELVSVDSVIAPNYVKLANTLASVPPVGTAVRRPAVQNVRIDDRLLEYYRDFTFNASTGVLTLEEDAEANVSPVYILNADITFTDASRDVTGSGFQANIKPGYMLGVVGQADYFEVLSVDSDVALTLRTPATYTDTASGRYKPLIYNEGESVLSLDCLGRTADGLTTGDLIDTAPGLTKLLLTDLGLEDEIDEASFDAAEEIAYQSIGITVPEKYTETSDVIYREVLNNINKSVFGSIYQTSDFKLGYHVLRPKKSSAATKFSESDILKFTLEATNKNIVRTLNLEYLYKEYDYLTKTDLFTNIEKDSDKANYELGVDRSRTVRTYLVDATQADIIAARWSFILSNSTSRLSFTTKLQGALLEIGNIIEIEHRKFFERFGSTSKTKLLMVEAVRRDGADVAIEATDLSNTFNRVACITDSENDYSTATESEKLYGGYITDEYGLIDNDPDTHETNLIF